MSDTTITERMQREWNERAREDANFYVAFGRRDQDDDEFFATAAETVHGLEWEMKRLPAGNPRVRRAVEIGCGPGRLLKPMSKHFGEIHGVDVSDEMIARARRNLRDIPHAHAHHASGSDLKAFADESFDFVYSYAVFQHIPSADVVWSYLREAHRVMKPGAILRAQLNGLPQDDGTYDTWSGVRISADQIRDFTRKQGFQLLALEGVLTQYMWTTWRKPGSAHRLNQGPSRIRRVTNAHNSEPVAPTRGRYSSITLWLENFPEDCDLNQLEVTVGARRAFACYIGPKEADGLQQLNVMLPEMSETGLLPIKLKWRGEELCAPGTIRVIPPGPQVPIVLSVADGVNLLSGTRIVSGTVKVTIEETSHPESFQARINGIPVNQIDIFCADPLPPRYEINLQLPQVPPGFHNLEMQLGSRKLPAVPIEIAPPV